MPAMWDECAQTLSAFGYLNFHLLNWTLSHVLYRRTHLHLFQSDCTLFSIVPHVFGCMWFVQNHSLTHTKLDDKAIKCIFLGILTYLRDIVGMTLFLVICITHLMSHFLNMFHFMQVHPLCRAMLMRWFLSYLTCFHLLFLYLIQCRYPLLQLLGQPLRVHSSLVCSPANIFFEL